MTGYLKIIFSWTDFDLTTNNLKQTGIYSQKCVLSMFTVALIFRHGLFDSFLQVFTQFSFIVICE